MRRPAMLAACSLALIGLGLAACSSSGSGSSGNTSPPGSGTSAPPPASPGSASAPTGGTYNLLAIVASSGPLAAVTSAEVQGLQAGTAFVNAHGGIDGKTVKLTVKNDNADPTTAANLVQSALSGGSKPDLVYAGTTSNETAAILPILTQNKILSIQTSVSDATIDPSKNPYAFSLASRPADFASELAAALGKHYPNVKKIGIIIGNDVNGSTNLANEKKALEAKSYTLDIQQYNPANTVDMTPQLQRLKADNPDLLVAGGFGAVAGYILKSRGKLGWNIPLVGDASFSSNALPTLASAAELKGVSVLVQKSEIYKPLSQQNTAFKTLFNTVKPSESASVPFNLYAFGWDDLVLAKVAGDQAKAVDAESMTKALENLSDPSDPNFILGSYKYSAQQHSPIADTTQSELASPYSKFGLNLPFGQTG